MLPVPDHYTYLGVEFGVLGPGEWSAVVTRLLGAARNRTRELLWANGNRYGLRAPLQVRLWTCIRSAV